jgi:hypothetical protein
VVTLRVVIGIAEDYRARLAEVVDHLTRAGLHVERVLDAIGVVTGSVQADAAPELRTVPGVESVEPDRTVEAQA